MKKIIPVLFVTLMLVGCVTDNSSPGFFSRIFGRKANAVKQEEVKVDNTEKKVVTAAHTETVKVSVALEQAAAEHPDSVSVAAAKRFNSNALTLLNQIDFLPVGVVDDATATARNITSFDAAARRLGEQAQSKVEGENRRMSQNLEDMRGKLKQLGKERDEEAAKNLVLANELRTERIVKWASAGASCLLGLMAIAYKLNIGRLQTGIAEALSALQTKHPEAAPVARGALDAILHTGEQNGVAQAFFALTKK